jgi:hypothetical protein
MHKHQVTVFEVIIMYVVDHVNMMQNRLAPTSAMFLVAIVIVIAFCKRITSQNNGGGAKVVSQSLEIKVP